jgi:DNA-directed RNA polymerase
MIEQQEALEAEMRGLGATAFRRNVEAAKAGRREANTTYGQSLLKGAIPKVSDRIDALLNPEGRGDHGRTVMCRLLQGMDPDMVALIAGRVMIDGITSELAVNRIASMIGQALEDERRFRFFEEQNGVLFHATKRALRKRTSNERWQRKIMQVTMNNQGMEWDGWAARDKALMGMTLIDVFIKETEMVEYEYRVIGRTKETMLRASPEIITWINGDSARKELLCPMFLPTIIPPKPWEGAFGGGYHTRYVRMLPLVKGAKRGYMEEMDNRVEDMPLVYKAVNAIQETPWRINTQVMSVMREVWAHHLPLGDLPSVDDAPLPACPKCNGRINVKAKNHACLEEEGVLAHWKRTAAQVYERNAKMRSKRLQFAKVIWLAEKFAGYPEFFFPVQLDFRGRVYAVPPLLNPQGPDWSRGLLTFAEGKTIDTPEQASWLAIHGANCFGIDKVAFNDRVAWVEEHETEIFAVAADPLANTFWSDAENPWQFLAFCFEWTKLCDEGYGKFVSTLPVQLDGSCNGLQHFSAMLRDTVGGKAVNLVPGDLPEDIYQRVADVVVEKLKAMPGEEMAQQWLVYGVTRKVTKRPVMVLPYGGTLQSCREYIFDYIVSTGNSPWPSGATFKAAIFLAPIVWSAIGEVVVAAKQAMAWLQKTATVASKENIPLLWTTPLGFPVMQVYQERESKRLETALGGVRVRITVSEDKEVIDKVRQRNGVAPNFVHSLDACALMGYVVMAQEQGIRHFSLVHDSFGTLAADTALSAALLRRAFVDIYKETDPLVGFQDAMLEAFPEAKLPPIPARGCLDIEAVLTSRYFFA